MLSDTLVFIRKVGWLWITIVGGAALSAISFFWGGLGGSWSRASVAVVAVLAVFGSFFKVWRDEYLIRQKTEGALEVERKKRPKAALSVTSDKGAVFLSLLNDGAQGSFTVLLTPEGALGRVRQASCLWRPQEPIKQPERVIAPNMSRQIVLAEHVSDKSTDQDGERIETVGWRMFYVQDDTMQAASFGNYEASIASNRHFGSITVEVVSEPEMAQGVLRRKYRLHGSQCIDVESFTRHHVAPRHKGDMRSF